MNIFTVKEDKHADVLASQKFSLVYNLILDCFKSFNYSENSYFDSSVFFLSQDRKTIDFKLDMVENEEPNEYSIFAIIKSINQLKSPSSISICVNDFITELSIRLINSKSILDQCISNIFESNGYQKMYILQYKADSIEKIMQPLNKSKSELSSMTISLGTLEMFPMGIYSFVLKYREINYNTILEGKMLLISKRNLTIPRECVYDLDLDQGLGDVDKEFEYVNFKSINSENSLKDEDDMRKSGITLIDFNIEVFRNDRFFGESERLNIIELFLVTFEEKLHLNCNIMSSTLRIPVMINYENSQFKNLFMSIDVRFNLSMKTKLTILRRIEGMYSSLIALKLHHENFQRGICSRFSQIEDDLVRILDEEMIFKLNSSTPREENCCSECLIF